MLSVDPNHRPKSDRVDSHASEFVLQGREVSCFALQYVFLELEQRGIAIEPLVADLPYSLDHLRDPGERVDWQTLCRFATRLEDQFGERQIIEMGMRAPSSPLVRWMTVVARTLFTPNEYYRWALREFCRKFACIESSMREIEPHRLRCYLFMREGYEPSVPLFNALGGGLTIMPTLLGMARAEVTSEMLPNGAILDVRLPQGGGHLSWLRRLVTWPWAWRWAASELRDAHAILHERYCELIRKDAALQESERNLRALMTQASDAIVLCDAKLAILDVNMRACDWFDRPREELLSMRASELLDPKRAENTHALLLGPASAEPFETTLARRDGTTLSVEVSTTRLDDGHVLWIMRDISIRKRIEEDRERHQEELEKRLTSQAEDLLRAHERSQDLQRRVMQAEHLRAAENLAASLAHAINNPLAALIGTLEMERDAGSAGSDEADRAHGSRHALRLAKRVSRIVAQTLQLFQKGSLEVAPECPRALLNDVREELEPRARQHDVTIEIDAPSSLPTLEVNRALITTGLVAIAENGIEAMQGKGRLRIRARRLPRLPILEIRIIDDGDGIPHAIRERILEPFFTTKGGGTGLGLAIADDIIRGHGGRLQIAAGPSGGTVVTVELLTEPGSLDGGCPPPLDAL